MAARQLCGLAKALGGGKAPCPPLPIGPAPAPRPLLPHPWARRAAVGGSSAARVQTTRFRVPATSRRSFCGASAAEAGAPAAAAAAAARLRVGLGPGVPRIAGGGGQSWGWHRMASSSGRTPGQPNPLRAGDGAKSAERSTSTATSPPPRTYTVSPVSAAIVRKRVRAMEDAGVIKPGALSYQVLTALEALGDAGMMACIARFKADCMKNTRRGAGPAKFKFASRRMRALVAKRRRYQETLSMTDVQALEHQQQAAESLWLQPSADARAAAEEQAVAGVQAAADVGRRHRRDKRGILGGKEEKDKLDRLVSTFVVEKKQQAAESSVLPSVPPLAPPSAPLSLWLQPSADAQAAAEEQAVAGVQVAADVGRRNHRDESGIPDRLVMERQQEAAETLWRQQSADARSADRHAEVMASLQQQILGQNPQPQASGQTSILDRLFLQELANATDLNTLVSFLTSGEVMISFSKGGAGVVSVSPVDGTIDAYHLTACANRIVEFCRNMTPDELAVFQRTNRDSHQHSAARGGGGGGVPPRFAWFLDQAIRSSRAGSPGGTMRNPDTLLASFVAIGVEHQGLVSDVANVAAQSAHVLSGAQLCKTMHCLAQLVPGHLDRVEQMRSAYDPKYHANDEVQRLHASICQIAKKLTFERVTQAPGTVIAKYLYAVSHLGVPIMDFPAWESYLTDYRNKDVLKFDTAALTMLAQVYRKEGAVGTSKNPHAIFHKIAVQAHDQRDKFSLPDIIRILTALTQLSATDRYAGPNSGLNKFPGTIHAAAYNARHAVSDGGELPAMQLRASPLLEALLSDAVRQLRDGREKLSASADTGRTAPTAIELQALARFTAELFEVVRVVAKLRFHHKPLLEEIAAGFMQLYHTSSFPDQLRSSGPQSESQLSAADESIATLAQLFADMNHGPTLLFSKSVELRGLRKEHTVADVVQFFAGADIEIDAAAVAKQVDGRFATVTFADANEAQRAVLLDGCHIGGTQMQLTQITLHENGERKRTHPARSSSGGEATDAFFQLATDRMSVHTRSGMLGHLRLQVASAFLTVGAIGPDALDVFVESMSNDYEASANKARDPVYAKAWNEAMPVAQALQLVMAREFDPPKDNTDRRHDKRRSYLKKKRLYDLKGFLVETQFLNGSGRRQFKRHNSNTGNRWEGVLFGRLQEAIIRNGLKGDIFVRRGYLVNNLYPVDFSLEDRRASNLGKTLRIAVEFHAPHRYLWNSMLERGAYKLHSRLLEQLGWTVIHVPYWEFERLNGHGGDEVDYIEDKLAEVLEMWGATPINMDADSGDDTTVEDCYNRDGTPKIVNHRFKTERVKLRGLGKDRTIADVVDFFAGADIEIDAAAVFRKGDSQFATVTFADANVAQRAVLLDGRNIGERFMQLNQITEHKDEAKHIKAAAAVPPQDISRRTVQLRNLSVVCTEMELRTDLFAGYAVEPGSFARGLAGVRRGISDHAASLTGHDVLEGHVVFETAEEARRAVLERHLTEIDGRKVHLKIEVPPADQVPADLSLSSLLDIERDRRAALGVEQDEAGVWIRPW